MALRTALFDEHTALGAKMFQFAGWEMPLWYSTITEEHMAVRKRAGIFDVSHMGKILVEGDEAIERFDWLFTRALADPPIGKCLYSFLLDDSGCIVDDLIVTKVSERGFLVVCNAAMTGPVLDLLSRNGGASVTDLTADFACLAVQGPASPEILSSFYSGISDIKRFRAIMTRRTVPGWDAGDLEDAMPWASGIHSGDDSEGINLLVSRTGYTGEDGFEIITGNEHARGLWRQILEIGGEKVSPCGLGARDTLRLEMCYLLSGHDFDGSQTPLEAGEEKAVDWNRDFRGKEALLKQKREVYPRLVPFISVGSGVPREGYGIYMPAKEEIGRVTSGTISPLLKKGIGMGYVVQEHSSPGSVLYYGAAERRIEASVVEKPFLMR